MKKNTTIFGKKSRFLFYSIFLVLIYLELIVFLQNVMFYESIYFNIYYIIFVILLLLTLKLEFAALNSGNIRLLIVVTILITINPVISIFDVFDVNYMEIPIYINVCYIIYKLLRGEINE